jgi:transcriptional regulator of aroF, aroG, tyrA and aromatic amino acid transport
MRLEIKSKNRLGISQEILNVFTKYAWDLCAMEVASHFTYVHVTNQQTSRNDVQSSLLEIDGIEYVKSIDLLPTERRENHLQALLSKIPDPIIDIDENGIILAANQGAKEAFDVATKGLTDDFFIGRSIESIISQPYKILLNDRASSNTFTFAGQTYIADVSPAVSEQGVTGAVIMFRTMNALGRQISLMQTTKEEGLESIIGQSEKIKFIKAQTLRYANLDLPVLISGETGTGKELIARALHNASKRAKAPFLAINCAALPENLLESELFGYASGAFTGAKKGGKPGLFELADGGSLFLDEIAEMSVYLQAKLLRFLQDFKYRRVGGTSEITANVRLISASHQNLSHLIEKKLFREDLFYRLNVLNLDLPPLRERSEDITLLTLHFIENAAQQVDHIKPMIGEAALTILKNYPWPGNIRQLQSILFRVVALNSNNQIEEADLISALSQFTLPVLIEQPDSGGHGSTMLGVKDWQSAQGDFESALLQTLYPLFPTTRKLAQRLNVSHNKIAMKLRQYDISL